MSFESTDFIYKCINGSSHNFLFTSQAWEKMYKAIVHCNIHLAQTPAQFYLGIETDRGERKWNLISHGGVAMPP